MTEAKGEIRLYNQSEADPQLIKLIEMQNGILGYIKVFIAIGRKY